MKTLSSPSQRIAHTLSSSREREEATEGSARAVARNCLYTFLLAVAFCSLPLTAQAPRAVRALHTPIIDGRDNDDVWRTAPRIEGFRMFDPTEDGAPTQRTEARIVYDETSVYVFVRAFDTQPDSIIGLLSRRDVKTTSDQLKIMIDSYHDRRTGYEFAVNPVGVKRDIYTFDDVSEDVSWNAVWDVATQVDSLGWTAEFRIPLSQLRYAPSAENSFGIMIVREIARNSERDSWPALRRSKPGIASQFADVPGFDGLSSATRLEVSPYVLTRNESAITPGGFNRAQRGMFGGDVKYGITSNLTLDATINPDFGQVEADPATLNLTAFETFLTEQRPFFLEGTGIFQFGDDPTGIFYSRRIGRSPQLAGLVADPNADIPGASRILGAAKLSGRVGGSTSLGILAAETERVQVGMTTIEPATSYGVASLRRDFREGESSIGIIATGVRRSLDPANATYLRGNAFSAAIDARHRFAEGAYELHALVGESNVQGTAAAIARTQRSSVHFYQRPDDDLLIDTLATTLGGTSLSLSANKVAGLLRSTIRYQRTTPGYETNDLGFLSRADVQGLDVLAQLVPSKAWYGWRNAQTSFVINERWTIDGLRNSSLWETYTSGTRANGARASIDSWIDNALPTYCDRCARGGPAVRLSQFYNTLLNLAANPKLRLSPSLGAIYTLGDGGRSLLWRVRPYVIYRPSTRVSAELGTRYQRNRDNSQWFSNVTAGGSTHYLFAHLDQDLLSFTTRLDVTLRPALSLQMYAEPFVSAGHYTDVRELADARAGDYSARYRSYAGTVSNADFNEKSFNASAVLRWEYRPASTLFVVWTQAREQSDIDFGNFTAGRDYRNLFAARPDNVFLVKAAYWFGR